MRKNKNIDKQIIISLLKINLNEYRIKYSVKRMGLFGSVARDQADNESDIDIFVEMEPDLFKRSAFKIELEQLLGNDVDLVRYSEKMNQQLKIRIDQEAVYV